MELLYSTAGRIGEVVSINREDVDFPNREIVIYGQKGKKERKVYLTEGLHISFEEIPGKPNR